MTSMDWARKMPIRGRSSGARLGRFTGDRRETGDLGTQAAVALAEKASEINECEILQEWAWDESSRRVRALLADVERLESERSQLADALNAVLADRERLELEAAQLGSERSRLLEALCELAPHVGWRRVAETGLVTTSLSLLAWGGWGVVIVAPVAAVTGLAASGCVWVLSRAMEGDWRRAKGLS